MSDHHEIGRTACSSPARIGTLVVSDRASRGEYKDQGGEAINSFLARIIRSN
nr:hypothetical protein [Bradyrhizobium sp. CCBAU 53421]